MTERPVDGKKARLSATKQSLLEAWLDGRVVRGDDAQVPPPLAAEDEPFPLTEVQEAYWLGRHRAFELGVAPASYLEIELVELDVARLERALARLVAHHAMLRAIVQPDGRQRILPTTPALRVAVHDLRGQPDIERKLDAIRARLTRGIEHPDRWPLFAVEASLHDAGPRLHVAFDILIVDVQSVRILTRDLTRLVRDPEIALPPVRTSFRDHALARHARKSTPAYLAARSYWLSRLEALPSAPSLPLACAPTELRNLRFVRHAGRVPAATWSTVKDRIAVAKLTPTAALLTAFAQVLARRSAAARFTVNLTMYNRPAEIPGIEEVVGDFTSLTLVELDLQPVESFADRAAHIQRRLWDDLDHRAFDGVELLRERMQRLRSRGALMPIVFTSNLVHDREDAASSEDAALGHVVMAITQTPQVWIDHQVAEHAGDLVYSWDVVDGLFPPGLIEDMQAEYHARVAMLADPDAWHRVEPLVTVCTAVPVRPAPTVAPPTAAEAVAIRARDHVLARVVARLAEILGVDEVEPATRLIDVGVTSIGMIRLANALEIDLEVRPELDALFECGTASDVAVLYDGLIDRLEPAVGPARDGLILDPDERAAFTRAAHGLRRDLPGAVIALPAPSGGPFAIDPEARRTHRSFAVKPVKLPAIGELLAVFRRRTTSGGTRYLYPSAGGLYPVQVYLNVKTGRVEGIAGAYYYEPERHALIEISHDAALDRRIHGWNNRAAFDQCAFSIYFVSDDRAMRPLYGQLTREFGLIETGAMLELAMLAAPALGIGLCPVGRIADKRLRDRFAWHGEHAVLHSVLGGAIAPASSGDPALDLEREVAELSDAEVEALLGPGQGK